MTLGRILLQRGHPEVVTAERIRLLPTIAFVSYKKSRVTARSKDKRRNDIHTPNILQQTRRAWPDTRRHVTLQALLCFTAGASPLRTRSTPEAMCSFSLAVRFITSRLLGRNKVPRSFRCCVWMRAIQCGSGASHLLPRPKSAEPAYPLFLHPSRPCGVWWQCCKGLGSVAALDS